MAAVVKDILLDRYHRLLALTPDDFPCNQGFRLWLDDLRPGQSIEALFRNGTMSFGFIGLSEAVEILTGRTYYATQLGREVALGLVRHMRDVVDRYSADLGLNFTLLASSGEFISGRFPALDRRLFEHPVLEKGFYTNSFHVGRRLWTESPCR